MFSCEVGTTFAARFCERAGREENLGTHAGVLWGEHGTLTIATRCWGQYAVLNVEQASEGVTMAGVKRASAMGILPIRPRLDRPRLGPTIDPLASDHHPQSDGRILVRYPSP